jgi:hypothetical protein
MSMKSPERILNHVQAARAHRQNNLVITVAVGGDASDGQTISEGIESRSDVVGIGA